MIKTINKLSEKIGRPLNFMEVCGTHTVAIFKHGIRSMLPQGIRLLSGPGCPVCVTSIKDVDKAIAIAQQEDAILTTFGDMMRVPGGKYSLSEIKAEGADIRIVYSPLDSLKIAKENPLKKVVFFGAGFETTTPAAAGTLAEADRLGIENFYLYSVHKVVPPALELLLQSDDVRIDGFILPGHVSTIIGTRPYNFIPQKYDIPCAVTGFDAPDILASIAMLMSQTVSGRASVEIQYKKVVNEIGNPNAVEYMKKYFEPVDAYWRGIGTLPGSGLRIRDEWRRRDAEVLFDLSEVPDYPEPKGCMCGLVLRGVKLPSECNLFAKACTPERPIGACMVSTEGSCAAYYKFRS
ncbi:MAG: hydrogenase formation protein HypD [Dissulfurispiraceae bacterium]|jgi:hydrogenase expression/formation protein HypD|nr:hydrogenase formation protein HypD [Dissulfurispiraceae bacterium]